VDADVADARRRAAAHDVLADVLEALDVGRRPDVARLRARAGREATAVGLRRERVERLARAGGNARRRADAAGAVRRAAAARVAARAAVLVVLKDVDARAVA